MRDILLFAGLVGSGALLIGWFGAHDSDDDNDWPAP